MGSLAFPQLSGVPDMALSNIGHFNPATLRSKTSHYKANPKDETTGRRKGKHFQWLTTNIGYPKLRERLGAVIATMKLSSDWHDFKVSLRRGPPSQIG